MGGAWEVRVVPAAKAEAFQVCVCLCGSVWDCVGLHGFVWVCVSACVGLCGSVWDCVGLCVCMCGSVRLWV